MSPRAPITRFTTRFVVLPRPDIDTDQIIPARFLKTTQKAGLGPHAFHDLRYRPDGSPDPEFPLNRPEAGGAGVLVAGRNFGCGSSREHAVWALQDAGFRAVVSPRFADIFRANALANGLLPIETDDLYPLDDPAVQGAELTVDLVNQMISLPDGLVELSLESAHTTAAAFFLPPFSRHCLLNGIDELDFLMNAGPDIGAFERGYSPRVSTVAP